MEDSVEIDADAQLTEQFNRKRGRKKKSVTRGSTKKKTKTNAEKANASEVAMDTLPSAPADTDDSLQDISVSPFDYSVDNYFRAVDTIYSLCREPDFVDSDKHEIKRLSSSVTFLREWRHFNYQPRVIRFASQSEGPQGKDGGGGIKLPQFSSASVPKDMNNGTISSPQSSKDFVMYVGGPVWALDWCPRAHRLDCQVKNEFIAVATHPPDSLYHKIGAPLTGRGIIQIWCLLNASTCKQLSPLQVNKKAKRNSRKSETTDVKSTQPKKPRGRRRKQPINEAIGSLDSNSQCVQALAIQYLEDSPNYMILDRVPSDSCGHIAKECVGRYSKSASQEVSEHNDAMTVSQHSVKKNTRKKEYTCVNNLLLPDPNVNKEPTLLNPQASSSCMQIPLESNEIINNTGSFGTNHDGCSISKDVALPRLVLCLAHNGKVAWDVKWRPSNICDKFAMGYLAVLLGNGALEVWEVPLPRTMKVMYSSHKNEGTDPRFVKLEPVFRCSKLNCGDRQSIPLCVEWSSSSPHDLILAGCHDGVVALWKFSANGSPKETRPLVCFSADTVPIRVVAWAPFESDPESSNVIVTAGHKGLKFWDIRDPFRPLWDLNPVQRVIYSLDWLPDPRCVIISFDDGTLRILSLVKAAYDVPVTGKPFVGTQQQGLHSYYCSPFTIWSVQVSRLTGMVAYCCADGTVLRFQLTTRAVEKDPLRNRAPHYLCGSLLEEESALIVITSLPDIPFPMKKSLNEWGEAPRSIRGFLSVSNQEKRAMQRRGKAEMSEYQPLALCYGNDPEIEFESNGTMVSQNSKIALKTKASKKKSSKFNEASICEGVEAGNVSREGDEKVDFGHDIEVFPPKIVPMHRVRWNMNKGSERWLSYGGAGGIVRCQEIEVSDA